jgi:tetratricopeptide (TPR) repeat protein
MKSRLAVLLTLLPLAIQAQNLPDVPEGAQSVSLLTGEALYSGDPSQGVLDALETARADYDADPGDADNIIWYGRRAAYTGDYRGAIEIFSDGIEKHPDDARMYRHRGHRYISIREFDRAIADLEKAAELIEGTENETEPDGAPNALNIPVSSLHGNIWYHLGLAYYLVQDWDNAYRAYKSGFDAGRNDDNRVSTTHWLYMISCRKGDEAAAAAALENVSADMNVIENMSYHNLDLFYKGEVTLDELLGDDDGSSAGAAILYGAANWHYCDGQTEKADEMLYGMLESPGWASFGYIAAEADLAARQ